jgi:crotonobetainyl-CoA:carnitine CoA-transferase CaiB-like acyl-CoA transferase
MEQISGLAWLTGFADGLPTTPNGPCDPVAGTHATFALLAALEHRRVTGEGLLVEVPMVATALNVAAEQVVEYSTNGHLIERDGNRGPGAPQGVYLTADPDGLAENRWIAIAVMNDQQWLGLVDALGRPSWADDPKLATHEQRRANHDLIDAELTEWCRVRHVAQIVELLWERDVPVADVSLPHQLDRLEQLRTRGFFEDLTHPLTGTSVQEGYPVRFSAGPEKLHRTPSPTLGGDNHFVLGELLGMNPDEIAELEQNEIIGTTLAGGLRSR